MKKLSFERILEADFIIDGFSVTEKTIYPPEPFVCDDGTVLRERFFYVVKGKIKFKDSDGEKAFSEGQIVYLPYNVTYKSRWDVSELGKYISVNFVLRDSNGEIISLCDGISLLLNDRRKEIYNIFSQMLEKWTAGSYAYRLETRKLFYEMLYRVSVNAADSIAQSLQNSRKGGIYRAILYLENNYLSDITVEELAQMTSIKECMFRRAFKAEKGVSPIKYRNMLRLKKAYEMLSSGEFTVIEAAMITNFDDVGYFSKLFKRHYGISPSDCKRQGRG